jgi:two-component system chemotaxis response regulator CheB
MIKALIVDDSPTARLSLRQILETDEKIHIIGEASNGEEALRQIKKYRPDIVTMDVYLHRENGIQLTASIMRESPCPILIVTGVEPSDPQLMYRAMEAGALDVIGKPSGPLSANYEAERKHLRRLVRTLAGVPVVHRFSATRTKLMRPSVPAPFLPPESLSSDQESAKSRATPAPISWPDTRQKKNYKIVLIGASTGGPKIVAELLSSIPCPFRLPIVIVQHISTGFSAGFAEWLGSVSGHHTVVVDKTMELVPGKVYVAPDESNLHLVSNKYVNSRRAPDGTLHVPSFDALLQSAASLTLSPIAIVMTGMGSDGTIGLGECKNALGLAVAQSPESCVVDGMPGSAIRANLIDRVLSPDRIAALLKSLHRN